MSEFKPGDMVECVDDTCVRGLLFAGHRYIVEGATNGYVFLVEIQNHAPFHGFHPHRFRLIKPPATDIKIFREIVREVFEGANV